MMKKFAILAAAAALTGVSASAYASPFISSVTSLAGDFQISNFAVGNPNHYEISLTNLAGMLTLDVGPSGAYNVSIANGPLPGPGTATVEFTSGLVAGPTTQTLNSVQTLFSGNLGLTGVPLGVTPLAFGAMVPAFTQNFSINASYDGSTTPFVLSLVNTFFGTTFAGPFGSGSAVVNVAVTNTSMTFSVQEVATGWSGAGAAINSVAYQAFRAQVLASFPGTPESVIEAQYAAANPSIGGNFSVANVSLTATAIPEPASLALLGLGLAGLGAMRRRKTA